MERDARELDDRLRAYLADEAHERVARARGDRDADPEPAVFARHAWLGGSAAIDALGELRERGRLPAAEVHATALHLRRFVYERELASVRWTIRGYGPRPVEVDGHGQPFAEVVAELERGGRPERLALLLGAVDRSAARALPPIRDAQARADEAAARLASLLEPAADTTTKLAWVEAAGRFLDATRDLRDEVLSFLSHRGREEPSLPRLPSLLRAADLDDAVKRESRAKRVVALGEGFGVAKELGARVRVEAHAGAVSPRVGLALVKPPTDVRLLVPTAEHGILTELAFASASGRALALVLANPALPIALAHPVHGGFARLLGDLFALLLFDRERLARERRMPAPVQDSVRRVAASIVVLHLRIAAAATRARGERSPDALATAAREAIGLPVPAPTAALLLETPRGAEPRLASGLSALAAFVALRETFDEDFHRNPRTAELLRGFAARGGLGTDAELLAAVGGSVDVAPRRLSAFFSGRD